MLKNNEFKKSLLKDLKTFTRFRLTIAGYHSVRRMIERDISFKQYKQIIYNSHITKITEKKKNRFVVEIIGFYYYSKNKRKRWYKVIIGADYEVGGKKSFKVITIYRLKNYGKGKKVC